LLYFADVNGLHILAAVSRCLKTLAYRFDPRNKKPFRLAFWLRGQRVGEAATLQLFKASLQTRFHL
jgi:hypothetical protein